MVRSGAVADEDLGVLVSPGEAAARLGVNAATVKQWVRAGKLRARRFGGQLYISTLDIETLLAQGQEARKAS
jgi:excisionase family DNA binding protein